MIYWLQIYFQSGDFTNEGSSIWVDLITSTVGAIIGLVGAVLIYRWQVKRERMDTLKYASALIEGIIVYIKNQAESCTILAAKLTKISTDYDLYHKEASQNLKRLVERMDQDKLYHAFLSKYGRKEGVYLLFQRIYSQLDFADLTLSQLEDYLAKEQTLIADRKKNYLEYLEQAETKMALLTVNPNFQANGPLMGFLNQALVTYIPEKDAKTNEELSFPINAFVMPVIQHLTEHHPTVPECNDISLTLKKAANMYGLVKHKHENLAKSLKEFGGQLEKSSRTLSTLTEKLRTDFGIKS